MSDISQVIYTPPQAAQSAMEAVERTEKNQMRAIKLHLPEIKDYFAPAMAGQLISIIAQTSNYKSSFMRQWARDIAQQLMDEERDNESIIYVSVEEVIEEQIYQEVAAISNENAGRLAHGSVNDWDALRKAAIMVGQIPIYRIGESLGRAEVFAHLHLSNIMEAIRALVGGDVTGNKITPAAIFVDYLQALPFDPEFQGKQDRRLQVRSDIYKLRKMSILFDCPVIVGVQAKQNLQGAPSASFRIPGIYDGEESSSIGQRSDRIIQLWMPKMTSSLGTAIEQGNYSFVVTEDMLWIKIGKQRGGYPSGKAWMCKIDHNNGIIVPQEINRISLSNVV